MSLYNLLELRSRNGTHLCRPRPGRTTRQDDSTPRECGFQGCLDKVTSCYLESIRSFYLFGGNLWELNPIIPSFLLSRLEESHWRRLQRARYHPIHVSVSEGDAFAGVTTLSLIMSSGDANDFVKKAGNLIKRIRRFQKATTWTQDLLLLTRENSRFFTRKAHSIHSRFHWLTILFFGYRSAFYSSYEPALR